MSLIIPPYARILAGRFKGLCVGLVPGAYFVGLQMLFTFFIGEYDSVADMLRRTSWTLSESHFLSMIDHFPANRFMRRLRRSVLSHYKGHFDPKNFVFAIDDTDNPKYANLASVSNWRGSKGKYYGQKVLVLALVDESANFAIPLGFKFCLPKNNANHVKAPKLAAELLAEVLDFGFPKLPVVADSWFDSAELAEDIQQLGCQFVWETKSNRNVRTNPGPHVRWSKLQVIFCGIARSKVPNREDSQTEKWVAHKRILIAGRRSYLNAIAVYNRKNGREAFAFYASTDLAMSGARIWQISRSRWAIECLFRDLKQSLSFGRFPSGKENAVNLAVVIPFIVITLLRLDAQTFGLDEKQTIGNMLRTLRQRETHRNLDLIVKNSQHPAIRKLRNRMAQITGKPCVTKCGG